MCSQPRHHSPPARACVTVPAETNRKCHQGTEVFSWYHCIYTSLGNCTELSIWKKKWYDCTTGWFCAGIGVTELMIESAYTQLILVYFWYSNMFWHPEIKPSLLLTMMKSNCNKIMKSKEKLFWGGRYLFSSGRTAVNFSPVALPAEQQVAGFPTAMQLSFHQRYSHVLKS